MTPEKLVRKMLLATSRRRPLFLLTIILICGLSALGIRLYLLEPVVLTDDSMSPLVPWGKRVWVCKLPQFVSRLQVGDVVLAQRPDGEPLLRRIIGMPGDTLKITSNGRVSSRALHYRWEGESAFIDSREFYIPRAGDSLDLKELNDVSFDYASHLLDEQDGIRNFYVRTTLWQGHQPLPLERVGSTRIASRPVSVREIHGLPWQELYLVQLQLQREEPGSRHIHFERQIFRTKDSSLVKSVVVRENCYYLACIKGSRCLDSRELGYFPRSRITGRILRGPDFLKF